MELAMARLGIAAALVGAVIIFASFMFLHTDKLSGALQADLHLIEQKVRDERWEEAAGEVEKLMKSWDRADA